MAGSPHTYAEYNYQNAFKILFVMLIGAIASPWLLTYATQEACLVS